MCRGRLLGRRARGALGRTAPGLRHPPAYAGSLPGARYEAAIEGEEGGAGRVEEPIAVIPLGQIVRFAHDRRHPDSLSLEAADVLGRIVQGRVVEVVDKVLEDILRNDDEE